MMKPRGIVIFFLLVAGLSLSLRAWAQTEGRVCSGKPGIMPISYGDLITCQITGAGNPDTYQFAGQAGEVIHLQKQIGDPCMSLLDPSGETIDSQCGVAIFARKLSKTGNHTIKITDTNKGVFDYVISLDRVSPPSPSTLMLHFGQTLDNEINPGGDVDYYSFTGYAGDTVTLDLVRTCCVIERPVLELYNPMGVLVRPEYKLLLTGMYAIKIFEYYGYGFPYRLSLNCSGVCQDPRAKIQTPTPGSVLPGSSATFTWSSVTGAASYWLNIGSEKGVGNYFGASVGLDTSRTVGNLPLDGSKVYVRLFTKMGEDWFYDDYAYSTIKQTLKQDLLVTGSGTGMRYRDSDTGEWITLSVPASMIIAGDLDGDGIDDPVGVWPSAGGVWVKYSSSGQWINITSAAPRWITTGDLNGDKRDELIGIWGATVWSWDSATSSWAVLTSSATQVAAADFDKDGKADLLGLWPDSGVWVKYSSTGQWDSLATAAEWIAAEDMNADGKADLIGIWGSSIKYRDTATGSWQTVSANAIEVAAGDLDGDGKGDILGLWPGDGVWVKYSSSGKWERLCSVVDSIAVGRMR